MGELHRLHLHRLGRRSAWHDLQHLHRDSRGPRASCAQPEARPRRDVAVRLHRRCRADSRRGVEAVTLHHIDPALGHGGLHQRSRDHDTLHPVAILPLQWRWTVDLRDILERYPEGCARSGGGHGLEQDSTSWTGLASSTGCSLGDVGLQCPVVAAVEDAGGHRWEGGLGRRVVLYAGMGLPTKGRGQLWGRLHVDRRGVDRHSLRSGRLGREPDDAVGHRRDHRDEQLHAPRVPRPRRWERPCLTLRHAGWWRYLNPLLCERRQRRPHPALRLRDRCPARPQRRLPGPAGGGAAGGGAARALGRGLAEHDGMGAAGAPLARKGIRLLCRRLRDVPHSLG
mmetsp:Transcript_105141/g.279817  ORF Transcript_105141/g.279817 Transcript_105141/m.279817 type:complete len:340 (-) Transcript_105141:375-1394(-)